MLLHNISVWWVTVSDVPKLHIYFTTPFISGSSYSWFRVNLRRSWIQLNIYPKKEIDTISIAKDTWNVPSEYLIS